MRILTCYKFMFFHLVICLLPYFDVFLQCKLYFFNFYEDKCISHFLWPLDFEHRLKCFSIPVLELIHAFFYGCLFFLPFLSLVPFFFPIISPLHFPLAPNPPTSSVYSKGGFQTPCDPGPLLGAGSLLSPLQLWTKQLS